MKKSLKGPLYLLLFALGISLILIIFIIVSKSFTTEPKKTIYEELEQCIELRVEYKTRLRYSVKTSFSTVTSLEIDGNTAEVYGKVFVTDDYGDRYEGKFSGTVTFELDEDENIKLVNDKIEISTPVRSN